ncbi:MAG: hydantoinase/oxoprolinase family protein [Candidatus Sulfotelmatobacter sp.]
MPNDHPSMRFAVDVGGTFTDLISWDLRSGEIRSNKTLTMIEPSQGVLEVIRKDKLPLRDVNLFVHGTTLGINAVLEKKGARTGLITTKGFRDVLEIARMDRPDMYNILYQKPPALVPRHLRMEVEERINAHGNVLHPLEPADVIAAIEWFRRHNVRAVAVCLLHSYANPAHEEEIGEIFIAEAPDLYVTLSHRILREYSEYERTMSAVMNSYIQPKVQEYLGHLQTNLRNEGFSQRFLLLRSSGGAMSFSEARERPIFTLMSGPAGGVLGASRLAATTGLQNLITADGGGTSFDVSLIVKGKPRVVSETMIEGYKLLLPIMDIRSIGAGGGSIALVDAGGALQVGPESAGGNPGPVCYARGGNQPTVTDAALCMGLLDPQFFLGGEMRLDYNAASTVIASKIAVPLGLDLKRTCSGILAIVEAKMAGAIREITVEKGFDPRDFALLAFGGSGPFFACNLARKCEIHKVVIPVAPANFSAMGMLLSDLVHHYSRTLILDLKDATADHIDSIFRELEALGQSALEADGIPSQKREFYRSLDMRYFGQGGHSVTVPLAPGTFTGDQRQGLEASFHQMHESTYGHRTDEPVQIVHFRLQAVGRVGKPDFRPIRSGGENASHALKQHRDVYWRELDRLVSFPVYDRAKLLARNRLTGPAIIEEATATSVLGPGDKLTVGPYGDLVIEIAQSSGGVRNGSTTG